MVERDEALERLLDWQHDLGKYLVLPLRMLPRDADPAQLRAAASRALTATRSGPAGTRDAAQLWAAFQAELGPLVSSLAGYGRLEAAMDRALGWRDAVAGGGPLPRAALERDLGAVQQALAALRQELADG